MSITPSTKAEVREAVALERTDSPESLLKPRLCLPLLSANAMQYSDGRIHVEISASASFVRVLFRNPKRTMVRMRKTTWQLLYKDGGAAHDVAERSQSCSSASRDYSGRKEGWRK